MKAYQKICIEFFKRRLFLISWISLVVYLFYESFIFYKNGRQFYYLRRILGLGLCVSRGTATVLNLCCALVLLPLCKKLNQVLYRVLRTCCPGLFFFWLEKAKSFHMTVAITLVLFAVIHSVSHFVNLWNFSRGYDEARGEVNLATYRDQNPLLLLLSQAGITGVSMLVITLSMGLTSMRSVRQKIYNAFWYTHHLYMPFMLLLIIHPLSGALKEEVLDEETDLENGRIENWVNNTSKADAKFVAIKSKTWLWMALPLSCFILDLLWRICLRNNSRCHILDVSHMAGRTMSLTMESPHEEFQCRPGQYVLLQCAEISRLEWHPFTVVKIPTSSQRELIVWIRVRGDWTEALEKLLMVGPRQFSVLVDGPFSSPMEEVGCSELALCVAAGVGITPFVATLQHMLQNPKSRLPGRIHLLWIVRYEKEITWLADLLNRSILENRNANRPDRLHIELYVTNRDTSNTKHKQNGTTHMVMVNEKGRITNVLKHTDDETATLLTPNIKRKLKERVEDNNYSIAKEYPLLECRVKRGRPHWDRVFGYWVHLYPEEHLDLYCCGPKKLVKLLRNKAKHTSMNTKTKFKLIYEKFS